MLGTRHHPAGAAAGAADEVLPLNQIAAKVLERLRATSGISLNRV